MTYKKKVPLVIYRDGNRHVIGDAHISLDEEGLLCSAEVNVNIPEGSLGDRVRDMLNPYTKPIPLSIASHTTFGEVGIGWTPDMGVIGIDKWKEANPSIGTPVEHVNQEDNNV